MEPRFECGTLILGLIAALAAAGLSPPTTRPAPRPRATRRQVGRRADAGGQSGQAEVGRGTAILVGPVETREVYQVSLGRWSWRFSVPESLDLLDLADRVRGLVGMFAILGVAVFLSENRRAISRRVVFWGLVLQWGFALLVLRVPAGIEPRGPGRARRSRRCSTVRSPGPEFVFGEALVDRRGAGRDSSSRSAFCRR